MFGVADTPESGGLKSNEVECEIVNREVRLSLLILLVHDWREESGQKDCK